MNNDGRRESLLWAAMERELLLDRPYHVVRPDIVRKMLECGMRVDRGRIYVDNVVVANHALARALNVDRRVVKWTVQQIGKSGLLSSILSRTKPLGTSLASLAPQLGYITLVIETTGSSSVITDVVDIVVRNGMEIRQVLSDAPDITPRPKVTIVVAGQLSTRAFQEISNLTTVRGMRIIE